MQTQAYETKGVTAFSLETVYAQVQTHAPVCGVMRSVFCHMHVVLQFIVVAYRCVCSKDHEMKPNVRDCVKAVRVCLAAHLYGTV